MDGVSVFGWSQAVISEWSKYIVDLLWSQRSQRNFSVSLFLHLSLSFSIYLNPL